MNKPAIKRRVTFGPDISLDVSKVVEVDTPRRNLFLEEMGDGTFRITYSKALLRDVALLEQIKIRVPLAALETSDPKLERLRKTRRLVLVDPKSPSSAPTVDWRYEPVPFDMAKTEVVRDRGHWTGRFPAVFKRIRGAPTGPLPDTIALLDDAGAMIEIVSCELPRTTIDMEGMDISADLDLTFY